MARASGGAINMHPLSWGGGGTNGKDPLSFYSKFDSLKWKWSELLSLAL